MSDPNLAKISDEHENLETLEEVQGGRIIKSKGIDASSLGAGANGDPLFIADDSDDPEVITSDEEALPTPEEVLAQANEVRRLSRLLPSHQGQEKTIKEYQEKSVQLLISIARDMLGVPNHIIEIIKGNSQNTGEIARRLLSERNTLALAIINTANAFDLTIPFTMISKDSEGMMVDSVKHKLEREDSSNTDLLTQALVHIGNDYQRTHKALTSLGEAHKSVTSHVLSLDTRVKELSAALRTAEETGERYSRLAGELAKFPLRGFSGDNKSWLLRHKEHENIYIGLTPGGRTRKPEPYLVDFVPVRGLANAYTVPHQGTLSPPELRELLERMAVRKYYQMFDPDDYGIEKITTQMYGS
jgi:hypothetical protein